MIKKNTTYIYKLLAAHTAVTKKCRNFRTYRYINRSNKSFRIERKMKIVKEVAGLLNQFRCVLA